jgi:fructose-1,6-bisphosphatase/inositol monophosphatase family enzyme
MMDMCDLALGKYNLLINGGAHIWDVAPAIPILEKAGFEVLDWSGNKIDLASYKGQDQILTILAGRKENIELFFKKMESAGVF